MKYTQKILLILLTGIFSLSSIETAYSNKLAVTIAVIVNTQNSVTTLTAGEVKLYFLRKIKTRWPDNNKAIRPADRKTNCPEQQCFYAKILMMTAADVETYFVTKQYQNALKPQDKFNTDAELIEFVAAEPGAIGFISATSLGGAAGKVKSVLQVAN